MGRPSVREHLLESACVTFRRKGVHGASVLDLATDAGVPKGSVYNHFENKEALATEILERYAAQTQAALEGSSGPAIERIRGHFEWQIERTKAVGVEHGCLLGNFAVELEDGGYPRLRSAVRRAFDSWIEAMAGLIALARVEGAVRNPRTDRELATWLISSFEGAVSYLKATGDETAMQGFMTLGLSTLGVDI